ncbi:MAG: hypothetical protein FWE34_05320 [Defluviitaleaceae bacterium]|nr:hypothetical protein [Defluviitaleaceae bacterium]
MLGLDNIQRESIGLNHALRLIMPSSPYGVEKLKRITPFSDEALINQHFDNIEKLMHINSDALCNCLAHFKNIQGALTKLASGSLNEIELFEIKQFLLCFEQFLPIFNGINADLQLLGITFKPMTTALDILDPKKAHIVPFSLDDGFSDTLPKLRREGTWEEQAAEEMRIMEELSILLRPHMPVFVNNIENLGNLDLAMAKAIMAVKYGCTRPIISETAIRLENMSNPMVNATLVENRREMTPISLELEVGVAIITGANMGGKSVAIKTAALNVALCALGIPVFAQYAEMPLFDGIFIVSQDLQNASMGLSSFGGEVARLRELAASLATDFLFIALDEPARATNPAEGAAIVRALTSWLAESKSISLLSTHYDISITAPKVQYYRVAGLTNLPDKIGGADIADYMDYRLLWANATDPIPKDAQKICKMLGLDKGLMDKIEREYENGQAL